MKFLPFRRKVEETRSEVPIVDYFKYFQGLVGKELSLFVDCPSGGVLSEVISREMGSVDMYTLGDFTSSDLICCEHLNVEHGDFKTYIFIPKTVGISSGIYFEGKARELDIADNRLVGLEHRMQIYMSEIPKTKSRGSFGLLGCD